MKRFAAYIIQKVSRVSPSPTRGHSQGIPKGLQNGDPYPGVMDRASKRRLERHLVPTQHDLRWRLIHAHPKPPRSQVGI
jgi:hypothetical protein